MSNLAGRPGTLAAAALAVLALWEIATLVRVRGAAPEDGDWRAAAGAVDAAFEPGDLIVFAPRWVDPVGRLWLGHRIPLEMAGRMDAARYRRIWELSIRGARAPETAGLTPALDQRFGAVRLRRYDREAPAEVVWELAGKDVVEVGHEPHRCVKLAVGRRREEGTVTLGSQLVVYAGLADVWTRRDNFAWVDVRVLVDGEVVAERTIGNDDGWVALPVVATTPGPQRVALEAQVNPSRGDPRRARVEPCVMAEARR